LLQWHELVCNLQPLHHAAGLAPSLADLPFLGSYSTTMGCGVLLQALL
jgi:hypothetical protein